MIDYLHDKLEINYRDQIHYDVLMSNILRCQQAKRVLLNTLLNDVEFMTTIKNDVIRSMFAREK